MAELVAFKGASRPSNDSNGSNNGPPSTLLHGQRGLNGYSHNRSAPEASSSHASTSSRGGITANSQNADASDDATQSHPPPLFDGARPAFILDVRDGAEEAAELAHSQSESAVHPRVPSQEGLLSPSEAAAGAAADSVSSRSFSENVTSASAQEEEDMPQVLKGPYTERELTRPQLRATASASHTDEDIPGRALKSPALLPAASTESVSSSSRPRDPQVPASPLLKPHLGQEAPHFPTNSGLPATQPAERMPDAAAPTGIGHEDTLLTTREDSVTGTGVPVGVARGIVSPLMEASMPNGTGLPPKGSSQGGLSEWARDHPSAADPAFQGQWPMVIQGPAPSIALCILCCSRHTYPQPKLLQSACMGLSYRAASISPCFNL